MNRIKILGDEFFAEPKFLSPLTGSLQDLVPAVGLQDRDIILLFIFSDLFGHLHALAEDLHQFIVEVIDLVTKFIQSLVISF